MSVGDDNVLDVAYTLLTERRRRYVLYHLHDLPTGSATVAELVELVAAWEEMTQAEVPANHKQEIERELVATHLPLLAEANVIEYDPRSGGVKYYGTNDVLEQLLEFGTIDELP